MYTNEYYLNMILYFLNDVNNWKFFKNIEGYGFNFNKKNIPKYHYKTIYNKYAINATSNSKFLLRYSFY